MIDALVANGTVTLIALAVLALELVVVLVWWRNGTIPLVPSVANILSGATLILALRAALLDQPPTMVALWLGFGFIAHLADLLSRRGR